MLGIYTLSPNLAFEVKYAEQLGKEPCYRVCWYSLSEGADLGTVFLCEGDLQALLRGVTPALLPR